MKSSRCLVFYGRNLWSALGGAELVLSRKSAEEKLATATPGGRASLDEFFSRPRREEITSAGAEGEEVSQGDVLLRLALALHERSGQGATIGRTSYAAIESQQSVFLASSEPEFAAVCLLEADNALSALARGEALELEARIEILNTVRDDTCLGPSALSIIHAALARGIPVQRLSSVDSLVQFGWGRASRRIWAAETDDSRAIANEIAQDKDLTRRLLRAVGVPVSEGRVVTSAAEAWDVAEKLGLPAVVKPQSGGRGRGVSLDLRSRAAVEKAFDVANAYRFGVVVEKHVSGVHHRVLVVGDRVVAATRASEEVVFGDGKHTIAELVAHENQDPHRSHGHASILTRLELDPIALELLERRELSPSSVPAPGDKIFLHLNGDLTTDVTDEVHPEVAALCVRAAKAIGLVVTGVDLVVETVTKPVEEQGGVVVELNARPGLLAHLEPVVGKPRDVGGAILATMFSEGETGRIPSLGVFGGGVRAETTNLLRSLLLSADEAVGAATSSGLFVGRRVLQSTPASDAYSVRRLLQNGEVGCLLLECVPEDLRRSGLGVDRLGVLLVADAEFDAEGGSLPFLLEGLEGKLVLPAAVSLQQALTVETIRFAETKEALSPFLREGTRAVFFEGEELVFAEGAERSSVALGAAEKALRPVVVLGAYAGLWALGYGPERLRGLGRTFEG